MSPLAMLITGWAATYGYVGSYYGLLYSRRPSDRAYLAFGLVCAALAIYATGTVVQLDAETVGEAAFGVELRGVGVVAGLAFFVDYCHQLVTPRLRLSHIAYGWASIGLAGISIGGFIELDESLAAHREVPFHGTLIHPALTMPGVAFVVAGLLLAGIAWLQLLPEARTRRDIAMIAGSNVFNLVAAIYDFWMRIGGHDGLPLTEHVALVSVLVMSYVLLQRYIDESRALERSNEELSTSYAAVRDAQAKLVQREQLAAVGELSAVIAHEVRNPLAIIKNAVSGLRRGKLRPGDEQTLLSIVEDETERLHRLMHDLLAYARPAAPSARDLAASELVQRALRRAMTAVETSDRVEIIDHSATSEATVHGDPELLRHALVNVVENALHAMPDGGTFEVTILEAPGGDTSRVAIAFRDEGPGMDPETLERAREPFFTTRATGTGLGLAIVERVVRSHGGAFRIDSDLGVGTTVTLELPTDATTTPRPSLRPLPAGGEAPA